MFRDRTLGASKMHWRIAREAVVLVPALRRSAWHPAPADLGAGADAADRPAVHEPPSTAGRAR